MPVRATGCALPDGSLTDAECSLLPPIVISDEAHRVWARRLASTVFRRRGRLRIHPGKSLLFIDEPAADLLSLTGDRKAVEPDLERDIGDWRHIRNLVRSDVFTTLLYGALCNTTWRHKATGALWHCSWRHAGGIVAALRCESDYLDWYCSGGESLVDDQVLAMIEAVGWGLAQADPPEW